MLKFKNKVVCVIAFSTFKKRRMCMCILKFHNRCVCILNFHSMVVYVHGQLSQQVCLCFLTFHNRGVCVRSTGGCVGVHFQISQQGCACNFNFQKTSECAFFTITTEECVCILNYHNRCVCVHLNICNKGLCIFNFHCAFSTITTSVCAFLTLTTKFVRAFNFYIRVCVHSQLSQKRCVCVNAFSTFTTWVCVCILNFHNMGVCMCILNFHNRGVCLHFQLSQQGVCAFKTFTTGWCVCILNFHNKCVSVCILNFHNRCVCTLNYHNRGFCAFSTFAKKKVCVHFPLSQQGGECTFSTFITGVSVCILNFQCGHHLGLQRVQKLDLSRTLLVRRISCTVCTEHSRAITKRAPAVAHDVGASRGRFLCQDCCSDHCQGCQDIIVLAVGENLTSPFCFGVRFFCGVHIFAFFGRYRVWPVPSFCFQGLVGWFGWGGPGRGPEGWGPAGGTQKHEAPKGGPRRVGLEGWGPQNVALFFPLPTCFLSWEVFSWNSGGVCNAGHQNVHNGSSWAVV